MITDKPYQLERQMFALAIRKDPHELAVEYSRQTDIQLASSIGRVVTDEMWALGLKSTEDQEVLLVAGIQDTYAFYECVLNDYYDTDSKLKIANHPKTQRRLVELAMHSRYDVKPVLGKNYYSQNSYILSPDGRYITHRSVPTLRAGEGCPFAGNNAEGRIDPLFKRFANWTTRLVFNHYDLKQNEANMLSANS